jgi:hypothetical protein
MATDLRKPSYYLERFAVRNDDVFGGQVLADWDVYQLFNMKDPPKEPTGSEHGLLEQAGIGVGTTFDYQRDSFLGHPAGGRLVRCVEFTIVHGRLGPQSFERRT